MAAPRVIEPSTVMFTEDGQTESVRLVHYGADGQPVYVKAGVYWITNGPLLMASASLLGGYLGEGTPGDRAVFPAQVCTLDANLKNRVIECRAAAEGTVIDGFTIRRGSINAGGGPAARLFPSGRTRLSCASRNSASWSCLPKVFQTASPAAPPPTNSAVKLSEIMSTTTLCPDFSIFFGPAFLFPG